jgi:hypothetical protein
MASFRLMHRLTGVVLGGYRVLSATAEEIDLANHRLKESGSPMRFVIDLHPPVAAAPNLPSVARGRELAPVCDLPAPNNPGDAIAPLPA